MAFDFRAFAVQPGRPGYLPDPARPIALRVGGHKRRVSLAAAEEAVRQLSLAIANVRSRTAPGAEGQPA